MTLLSGGSPDFRTLEVPNKSAVATGKKTITTAGTAEQMPAQAIPTGYALVIKALLSNTTRVHIADTKAKAEVDANAYELLAGESVELKVTNLNELWVDANTNGEGVNYVVESD